MSHWQETDITQIADTRTTQVGMTKTYQYRIADVIARTPVPSVGVLCWSELYHAKGYICTKEYMTVTSGTNPGINIISKLVFVLASICRHNLTRHCSHGQRQNKFI